VQAKLLLKYGLLAFIVAQVASCVPTVLRVASAAVLPVPDMGTPPFTTSTDMNVGHYAALRRFPDLASCLWGRRDLSSESLERFAWNRIDIDEEAEVCLFRVMSSLGGPAKAVDWFRSQGLRASIAPEIVTGVTDSLVYASWSISNRGRLYSALLFGAPWSEFPFSITTEISVHWTDDRSAVQSVQIINSSK
jgi:hypothetical protein